MADPDPGDTTPVTPIPHEALRRDHLPRPRAPFEEVVRFAYTFDGYARFGMQLCGELGNRAISHFYRHRELPPWLADLDRLRGCLFFEVRRWILLEREPDTRALLYVRALLDAIETRLERPMTQSPGQSPGQSPTQSPAPREADD